MITIFERLVKVFLIFIFLLCKLHNKIGVNILQCLILIRNCFRLIYIYIVGTSLWIVLKNNIFNNGQSKSLHRKRSPSLYGKGGFPVPTGTQYRHIVGEGLCALPKYFGKLTGGDGTPPLHTINKNTSTVVSSSFPTMTIPQSKLKFCQLPLHKGAVLYVISTECEIFLYTRIYF